MSDIDRLIEAWEIFRDSNPYEICNGREFRAIKEPEYCMGQMIEDTITLLREQQAKVWVIMSKMNEDKTEYNLELNPLVTCGVCKHCHAEGFINERNVCDKHPEIINPSDNWYCADGEEDK